MDLTNLLIFLSVKKIVILTMFDNRLEKKRKKSLYYFNFE